MPQAEGRGLTQNFVPRLTTYAISYLGTLQNSFIGRDVFPGVGVGASTGEYNILPRDEFLRLQGKRLSNGESPPEGGFGFQKDTYSVHEYGMSTKWTARDLNNAAVGGIAPTSFINMKTQFVTLQALLAMENDVAVAVRTAANWTETWTGVNAAPGANQFLQWNDHASTPVQFVKQLKVNMLLRTGFTPNKMVMPQPVVDALGEHPDLIDRVKFTGSTASPGKVNLTTLAELFEIDRIFVPKGVINTAAEGAAANIGFIWGKDVFLFYSPDAASMETPSAGLRFNWNGASNSMGQAPQPGGASLNSEGLFIDRYVTKRPQAEWVESRWYSVPKVTAPGLGILLVTAVA